MTANNHSSAEGGACASERTIHVRPRYYRRLTDPGVDMTEINGRFAELDWHIPLGQVALVCLDVWDRDIHADMRAIDDRIVRERIVPLVEACRREQLLVVHAPAWPTARRSPSWLNLVGDEREVKSWPQSPDWPPAEFRRRTGPYACYARPVEPRAAECDLIGNPPGFHELVQPGHNEPVVATGEELHRLCAARGILHLMYVGFHTPGCMTNRSYGVTQMLSRGYSCILLRDCTNGMETHETFARKTCLRGAIAFLEQTGVTTMTSEHVLAALKAASTSDT